MTQRWFRNPRPDYVLLAVVGVVVVVSGIVTLVRDLAQILPNTDVPVPVDLTDVPHELLLDGTAVAEATEAVIRVSALGPVPYAVVLAAAVLPTVTLMVVAVCFVLIAAWFWRGDVFTTGTVAIINTAAIALALGSVLIPTLDGMAANSALATVGITFGQLMGLNPVMFMAGFLLAVIGYAFQRGVRLQADTEGLV